MSRKSHTKQRLAYGGPVTRTSLLKVLSFSKHPNGVTRQVYEIGEEGQVCPPGIAVVNQIDGRGEANARRLVACWNACQGITTETLEREGRS
jgi:hypothetical protein